MLVYPNREYKVRDKVIVECESRVSSRCKRFYSFVYINYMENLKENDNKFICKHCLMKLKTGVETLGAQRPTESILEANKRKIGMKYKMSGKPRKKIHRRWWKKPPDDET